MAHIDFDKEENRRLLTRLYAYARGLFNELFQTDPNWKGKGFADYVQDAIVKHLADEDNYDSSKSPLEYHLKYNVLRQAITNDVPAAAKKAYQKVRQLSSDQREMYQKIEIADRPIDPDELGTLSLSIRQIDNEYLFKEIEAEINNDPVVEKIYLAVVCDKYHLSERAEICEDFDISFSEFDNGKRRFITILKRVFRKLKIKP